MVIKNPPNEIDIIPAKKILFLPYFDIKIEHGKVDIIVIINWRLNGKVDNHPNGAMINPAKPVVIILIFIAVIENTCADAK